MSNSPNSARARVRALSLFEAHAPVCRNECRSGIMSHQREKFCDLGRKVFNRGGMVPHSSAENAWWTGMQANIREASHKRHQ